MRKYNILSLLALFVASIFTSCSEEDKTLPYLEIPIYGMQIKGTATEDKNLLIDAPQVIEPGSDYSIKEKRSGMNYAIYYLKAGSFQFLDVQKSGETVMGVSDLESVTQEAETVVPFTYEKGVLVAGSTDSYTVPADGLYYIITDEETSKFWMIPITSFDESNTSTLGSLESASSEQVDFLAPDAPIGGGLKIRLNTAWKLVCEDVAYNGDAVSGEDHVRPVLSYGGSATSLSAEGDDIELEVGDKALNIKLSWTPGQTGVDGFEITTTESDFVVPVYPESLWMIGQAAGGWDWAANGIEMHPVHSHDNLFWAVVWLDAFADGGGIKFAPNPEWTGDFGGTPVADNNTDGIGVSDKSGDNTVTPSVAGHYLVVVDYDKEQILVTDPEVYLIGDVMAGVWDSYNPAAKFTVDNANEVLSFTGDLSAGNIRMYISGMYNDENWLGDWWQTEFNVFSNVIEYRATGGDQAAVTVSGGTTTVKLKFKDNTGSID